MISWLQWCGGRYNPPSCWRPSEKFRSLEPLLRPVIGMASANCGEAGLFAALKLCRKERFDLADEAGPFVDEARIKLQQCGAGFDFFECALAAVDATNADERNFSVRRFENARAHG